MKKVQIFISYCGDDTHIMHDLRDNYLAKLKGEYALEGAEIVIREMETECVDKWDVWMVGAVKSCDILVCILTDNVLYPKEETGKRVLEELCVARNNNLNIIPIVFSSRGLPDEYFAHIGRISQIWYGVGDTQEQKFTVVKDKATLLINGILSGNKVKQYESLKIKSGYQFSKFDGFVGRKEEMEKISSSFDQSNLLILKGEGGIGKTSLAKAYFNASDSYENGYIVDASSGITQTIQNFPFEDTLNEPNAEERYAGNLKRLKELSEKIIIILDNYDVEGENDSDTLAQLENMACKYIITSRIGTTRSYNTIELGRMPDEDLIKLVYNIHSTIEKENKMSKEEVEKLLVEFFANVNGLTIAVELASAIMRDGDVSLIDINNAILSCNDKVTTGRRAGQKASAFDHLASLYSYAMLSKEEHEVLKVLTHISPAVGMERKKLKEYLKLDSNDVINDLIRKSFIRMDEDKVLSMHPLMSDVYYKQEKVADQEGIREILDYVSDFDFSTDKTLTLTEASLKNIATYKYLVEKREASFKEENLDIKGCLYNKIGFNYYAIADFRQELEYNLKALEIRKIAYADNPNHPDLATSYDNMGVAYGNLGDYPKELEYKLKALGICEIAYADNPNHPDLATSYNNVGYAYVNLGDNQKALEYQLKALGIWEIAYADNPDHPDLALSYNNVGMAYGNLGDNQKALEYNLKALKTYEKAYVDNPNHPDLATSYNNVGYAYVNLGDNQKALEYLLKALEIRKIVYAD
ncbi:MAG: tetratricopeptide repeat protein, partial [Clostridia bacterium]|nr:tetratricopeptide repeat protein [Clostridia bacterium]